jgi:hypothetical protein
VTARREHYGSPIVSFRISRISRRAIRAGLPELRRLIYTEAHDAPTSALVTVWGPAEVHLPVRAAADLLHWLKAITFRQTRAGMPHAPALPALMEAAESLEFALEQQAER